MKIDKQDERPDHAPGSEKDEHPRRALIDDEAPESEEPAPPAEPKPEIAILAPLSGWGGILFIAAIFIYFMLAISCIDGKYVDFSDGNYLYLSWRLLHGAVLYQDLPSPQPPFLLFWGAALMGLGGGDPILIRLWQVVQHALTACCVLGITRRLFPQGSMSLAAGIIYLFLPEGVWWASGFTSEPPLILLQSFNLLLFLTAIQSNKPSSALYASGFVSAMCLFINMTALPYIMLQWFFIWYRFKPLLRSWSTWLCVPALVVWLLMYVYSGGQYMEHVFFRQVGTFPSESVSALIGYCISKLMSEGGDILFWEGGFVFASMAGILLYAGDETKPRLAREYVAWWGIFSLGSIIFVTKGGTVEYIFTLGEPAVAVFAAFFFISIFIASGSPLNLRGALKDPLSFAKATLLICLVAPGVAMKPMQLLYYTFTNSRVVYELSSSEMDKVNDYVERHTSQDDAILAPPYYAYTARRRIANDMSSLFILFHAYHTDLERLKKNRDLPFADGLPGRDATAQGDLFRPNYTVDAVLNLDALFAREPQLNAQYPAISLFLSLRQQILNGDVRLLLVNSRHPFFGVAPLDHAIRTACIRAPEQLNLANREENLIAYVPRL
ncbi:MAG: hypothetical protein GC154_03500 [bacterium]|nr:hypothetical protein [bacterium]